MKSGYVFWINLNGTELTLGKSACPLVAVGHGPGLAAIP